MKIKKKRSSILIVVFLLASIVATITYCDNNVLQVSQYTVTSHEIPASFKGFKILQLSDLHSKNFGNDNHRLAKKIDGENPNMIVMTGDMINTKDADFEVFINLAKQLSKKYDTYYVVGNHEQNLSENKLKMLMNELEQSGVKVLDNEKVAITKGNNSINLYGMWFNLKYYKDVSAGYAKDVHFGAEQMKSVLGNVDDDSYNVMLTHNPVYFSTYSSWGADLTLSGHMHGGMMKMPFKGGLLSPEKEFFPEYDAGKYRIDGKELIVNRGLGNGGFGIRMFNRPEISVITLSN